MINDFERSKVEGGEEKRSQRIPMPVQVTVNLPEEILNAESGEAPRRILEEFALEGYKS